MVEAVPDITNAAIVYNNNTTNYTFSWAMLAGVDMAIVNARLHQNRPVVWPDITLLCNAFGQGISRHSCLINQHASLPIAIDVPYVLLAVLWLGRRHGGMIVANCK